MAMAGVPPQKIPAPFRPGTKSGEPDDGLSAFSKVRARLFGIAYRTLGSASEAEDVVQDVWMRWQSTDRSTVRDPSAFLATTTTRLCINLSKSAHSRREAYVGEWLPEPVDTTADPTLGAERAEALELAVLVLLERLSPTERAAYVLREAFDYSYRQIADILQMEEANARQLVTRGRRHIANARSTPVSSAEHRRLLEVFIGAAQSGDLATLEGLFAEDIVSYSDGGGFVRAARVPVYGRERVAKVISSYASHFWNGLTLAWTEVNGQAAVVMYRDRTAIALVTIDASAQGINRVMWFMRPSKLTAVVKASQRSVLGDK